MNTISKNGDDEQYVSLSELMLPIVEAIKSAGTNRVHNDVISEKLRSMGYPDAGKLPDGYRTKLEERVAWAKSYLKSYGALSNPRRSFWSITDTGMKLKAGDEGKVIRAAYNRLRKRHPDANIGTIKAHTEKRIRVSSKPTDITKVVREHREQVQDVIGKAKLLITLMDKGVLTLDIANRALLEILKSDK